MVQVGIAYFGSLNLIFSYMEHCIIFNLYSYAVTVTYWWYLQFVLIVSLPWSDQYVFACFFIHLDLSRWNILATLAA